MPPNPTDKPTNSDQTTSYRAHGLKILGLSYDLIIGFTAMLALVIFVTVVGLEKLEVIHNDTTTIVNNHLAKIHAASLMVRAARKRVVTMQKMSFIEDPFDRDELALHLDTLAGDFVRARLSLLDLPLTEREQRLLKEQGALTGKALPIQREIIHLLARDQFKPARELLIKHAIPAQDLVLDKLDEIYHDQINAVNAASNNAQQTYADARLWVRSLSAGALTIGLLIAMIIVRHSQRTTVQREQDLAKIAQMNLALADKAHQLERARTRAQQANNSKSAFLANMSHEIRTPLTAVIGFAESMFADELPPHEHKAAIERILRNSKHLLHIINEILDLSKIEAGKLEVERLPESLFTLLSFIESVGGHRAREKGLSFNINYTFPLPATIHTDPTRLKQILLNLVSNAVKFTEHGSVSVSVMTNMDQSKLHFKVVDTGIGMTQDQLAKVFNSFTQADTSTTRKYGGTGLGLSITRFLCERLECKLNVQSSPNQGSAFEVILDNTYNNSADHVYAIPTTALSISDSQQTQDDQLSFTGRVLVAEDNPDNQILLRLYIERVGAQVTIVENGKQALELARTTPFELILMDIQMPVMGGEQAIISLRDSGYQNPIAALTANAMKQDQQHYLSIGCDEFLAKPIDRAELNRVLRKFLPRVAPNHSELALPRCIESTTEEIDEYAQVRPLFVGRLPDYSEKINAYHTNQNWPELARILHDLKGMGGGFGFPNLSVLAAQAEQQIHAEQFNQVNQSLQTLSQAIEQIHGAFSSAGPHKPSTSAAV